jgi:hypothetical protein
MREPIEPPRRPRPLAEILREAHETQARIEERLDQIERLRPRPRPVLRLVVNNERKK